MTDWISYIPNELKYALSIDNISAGTEPRNRYFEYDKEYWFITLFIWKFDNQSLLFGVPVLRNALSRTSLVCPSRLS